MTQNSYQLINLNSNIILSWPTSFGTGPVVCDINDVTTNANGHTITMPNATLVPNGTSATFNNISGYPFTILANDGTTTITTVPTGVVYSLYLYNNSTSNGSWRTIAAGGGTTAITTFTAESTDSSISITNGTVTPPSGTINFQLPTSLTNFNSGASSIGFPVLTKTNPNTWGSVTFSPGTNISITNPTGVSNGIAANPIFDLDKTITGLESITVGNVTISGDNILNTNNNQDLTIVTDGTANIVFNKYVKIDPSGNLIVNAGFNNPFTPKAWCVFTDTAPSNIITVQSSSNVSSVNRTANGTYQINFTNLISIANYAVFISLGNISTTPRAAGTPSTAFWINRTTGSVTIQVVDSSGTPVASNQYGTSVVIMST